MAAESGRKRRIKSKNWTEEETETLMEAYGARKAILEGLLGANLNFHEQKRAWEAVVEAVNAVGNEQRTAEQIKKRWENLVTAARTRSHHGMGAGEGNQIVCSFFQHRSNMYVPSLRFRWPVNHCRVAACLNNVYL